MDIKWVFFDVGSTLVDETECYNQRIIDAIKDTDITFDQFNNKRIEFTKHNLKGDIEAIKFFGLIKTAWHKELEKPYHDAESVLKQLSAKGFKIGIIANQSFGTVDRLQKWGLLKYISLVLSSAEEGVAKPEPEIFIRALNRADCKPCEAVMIGDRLDNDICPAKRLGMNTIWLKQGIASYQYPVSDDMKPDYTINNLIDILEILK